MADHFVLTAWQGLRGNGKAVKIYATDCHKIYIKWGKEQNFEKLLVTQCGLSGLKKAGDGGQEGWWMV